MIRCREVAQLITSDQMGSEPGMKRFGIKLHLMICKHCSRLAKQIFQLQSAVRRVAAMTDHEQTGAEDQSLEAQLLRQLADKKNP